MDLGGLASNGVTAVKAPTTIFSVRMCSMRTPGSRKLISVSGVPPMIR